MTAETHIAPIFPLFQGRFVGLLLGFRQVVLLLLEGHLMTFQAADAGFFMLVGQKIRIFPRFDIRLDHMALGAGLGVLLIDPLLRRIPRSSPGQEDDPQSHNHNERKYSKFHVIPILFRYIQKKSTGGKWRFENLAAPVDFSGFPRP